MHDVYLAASAEAVSARARAAFARSSTRRLALLIFGAMLPLIAAAAATMCRASFLRDVRLQ